MTRVAEDVAQDVPMLDAHERAKRGRTGPKDGARSHAHHAQCKQIVHFLDGRQAASTLHESSCSLLEMLDAVVELFELARRNEDCSEEDDARVVAMVEKSCATLRGIAASFALADLQTAVA